LYNCIIVPLYTKVRLLSRGLAAFLPFFIDTKTRGMLHGILGVFES